MRNLYAILGLERDADADAIKKAFREASLAHHPDRNPDDAGAAERFREVQTAYGVLSDPEKRAAYDAFGTIPGEAPSNEMPGDVAGAVQFVNDVLPKVWETVAEIRNSGPVLDQIKGVAAAVASQTKTPEGQENLKKAWAFARNAYSAATGKPT